MSQENKNIIPWVEKYRPSQFDNIVLDPINKTIFENIIHYKTFPNLLFYGFPGSGKCFVKNTPILMFDGSLKMVQDIEVGDKVMGDDSTERNVLSLGTGEDELYGIHSFANESYGVNGHHILCLKVEGSNEIFEMTVNEYLHLPSSIQPKFKVYKTSVDFPSRSTDIDPYLLGKWLSYHDNETTEKSIPSIYKINDRHIREKLLLGLLEHSTIFPKHSKKLVDDILFLARSLGKTIELKITKHAYVVSLKSTTDLTSHFQVVSKGKGTYYGFVLDGNHRFVLGDFSVSHNTSTIINLIQEYQRKHSLNNHVINKGNIIHLNASDERGIDIIRNQIHQFVSSKNLFDIGLKFVVLDEVDYMTKNAQQALKYLLQTSGANVRYCLICNYVSKIDESLQNEFICIRFNQLPKTEIYNCIKHICRCENIETSDSIIEKIQSMYDSDIRSMINFIQSNHISLNSSTHKFIVYPALWEKINLLEFDQIKGYIHQISVQYNIDKKQIIKNYFNDMIRKYPVSVEFLNKVELILHNDNIPCSTMIDYFVEIVKETKQK